MDFTDSIERKCFEEVLVSTCHDLQLYRPSIEWSHLSGFETGKPIFGISFFGSKKTLEGFLGQPISKHLQLRLLVHVPILPLESFSGSYFC